MKLKTFQYITDSGWSISEFPDMDSPTTLILVFCSPAVIENLAPLKELAKYYPQAKIMGCSSAGEICGSRIFDDSISVAIVQFEKTRLEFVTVTVSSAEDSYSAGEKIANKLNGKDLRGIFVLSDGLKINGSELVRGLNSINKKEVVITGGLAGDGSHFRQTWILAHGKILTGQIAAVGFYGDHIQIGHGSRGGWDIFGPERRITRSRGNILLELDGRPALQIYRDYLGEKAADLPASGLLFPLAIRRNAEDTSQLVRTILAVDEKAESLTFAGDMPQGYLAQLMRANFERLIQGANEAGRITLEQGDVAQTGPRLLIAISCVGRRLLLGERTEEEVESTLEIFPGGTEQVGFYSYGELSPHTRGNCDLHNQTMTLTSISEAV